MTTLEEVIVVRQKKYQESAKRLADHVDKKLPLVEEAFVDFKSLMLTKESYFTQIIQLQRKEIDRINAVISKVSRRKNNVFPTTITEIPKSTLETNENTVEDVVEVVDSHVNEVSDPTLIKNL